MPKGHRMLADCCYAVISGARDVVTGETDASLSLAGLKDLCGLRCHLVGCNSVIVTISGAKWLDRAFFRNPVRFCRSTAVRL
jgi:hypothetical protein